MIEELPLPKIKGARFKVYVNPRMLTSTTCPLTFTREYNHMIWCWRNTTDFWYNECEYYSYVVFSNVDDAIRFNKIYGIEKCLEKQQELWLRMKYL